MFKVGDVVKCVDNEGKESWLLEGVHYTVYSVGQCGEVSVTEDELPLPARFAESRFELVQDALPDESKFTPGRIYKPTIERLRELANEEGKRFNCFIKTPCGAGDYLYEAVTVQVQSTLFGSGTALQFSDKEGGSSVWGAEFIQWIEPASNPVVLTESQNVEAPPCPSSKVKSDGGSSDYYKLSIKRTSDGAVFECETGDIIAALVGDNFTLGNCVKALRRMWCDSQGCGKEGIDMMYDATKVKYFVDDFVKRYGKGDNNA